MYSPRLTEYLNGIILCFMYSRIKITNQHCKVEFNQSFCWFYSVPNLLVIQHLETMYLGGNHLRVVSERV